MAVMMSFNESMFQLIPGVGILLGGAIAAWSDRGQHSRWRGPDRWR